MEFESAKAYDRILVNSYFSRESVIRAYGLNSLVCYLGVDATAFAATEKTHQGYVIGVGSFSGTKNIEFIIRAVGRVPPPRPRLVWVGNYANEVYRAILCNLAVAEGVDYDQRLLVPQSELTGLLGGALAAVYAPKLEPFGYLPLEANACGLPVIAVAEGGVRETVRDEVNGLLVGPQPEDMASAIVRLRDNPEFARMLGRTGRELALKEWSLDAATDRLERHLHDVAKSR